MILFPLGCKTTKATNTCQCKGHEFAVEYNKKCVFPFRYNATEYFKCTSEDFCEGCFWCGTQYNVTVEAGWGVCDKMCFEEEGKNTSIMYIIQHNLVYNLLKCSSLFFNSNVISFTFLIPTRRIQHWRDFCNHNWDSGSACGYN